VIFFKNLQDAEMCEAAGKSSAKGKGHPWPRRVVREQSVAFERCAPALNCADNEVGRC
jgi:hypothetical protein